MSKAKCLDCEDILESKHRNDFVKCKCGNSFLDGGDDYFRGGGPLVPVSDKPFYIALDRDEALQKLLAEVEIDDIFDDDSFLDDYDDYNLGYQSGTLDERDRIIKLLENPIYHHTFFGPRDVNDEPVILHDGECLGCLAISEAKGEQK
jgi:hypothetical protein